ncbi:MAG: helix-turn-helix domain-containing protein [Chloroflexota bacterium]|nr:helix-turn-helix domain-containing protein [Chloroflexota bacterium]
MTSVNGRAEASAPVDEFVVTDLGAVKAFSDPLRIGILEATGERAMTAKEIAGAVGADPHKLYYLLSLLQRHGLLRLQDDDGERRYRAAARRFRIERAKVRISAPMTAEDIGEGIEAVVSLFLHDTGRDLRAAVRAGAIDLGAWSPDPTALLLRHGWLRLSPARAAEFHRRLTELEREFGDEGGEDGEGGEDARGYAYLIGVHPLVADSKQGGSGG